MQYLAAINANMKIVYTLVFNTFLIKTFLPPFLEKAQIMASENILGNILLLKILN